MTFGIGNPYQSIGEAIEHPAQLLYTDSELNLDAATGKLRWYYQAVPNDFKDQDMQLSPIATVVGGVPAIIGGGKMGIVYAMNASTGALLWKTPVGAHDGTDNDSALLLEHKLTIKLPYTWEPGSLGGVLTNMAVADGSVYVATLNVPVRSTTLSSVNGNAATKGEKPGGEIEALNLATGAVEWDTKVSTLPLGATTVVERPGLHHPRQREADRAQPDDRRDRLPARSCPRRPTRRSPSPGTRCWCPRAGPGRRPRAAAATRNWSPTPCRRQAAPAFPLPGRTSCRSPSSSRRTGRFRA